MKSEHLIFFLAALAVVLSICICVLSLWQPPAAVMEFSSPTAAPTEEATEPTEISVSTMPSATETATVPPTTEPTVHEHAHPVSAPIPANAEHPTRKTFRLFPTPMSLPFRIPPVSKMGTPPTPARTAVTAIWNWATLLLGTVLVPGLSRKLLPKPPPGLQSGNAPAAVQVKR